MTDSITTPAVDGQVPTELNTPWSLHFDRDGTEDYGIICDADGRDIVASHLPCSRIGDKTFESGTFWRPEKNDPVPLVIRQMQLMTAAPKLLAALRQVVDTEYAYDEESRNHDAAQLEHFAALVAEAGGLVV